MSTPMLQALLPADHVYRDEHTGKFVVAGTFHDITLDAFPGTLGRSVGLFVSLRDVDGEVDARVELFGPDSAEPLMRSPELRVAGRGAGRIAEFAVELPPLLLPAPGRYELRLEVAGAHIGDTVLEAHQA